LDAGKAATASSDGGTPVDFDVATSPPPPKGYQNASIWDISFFSYVNPLLRQAAVRPLEEHDSDWLCPPDDTAEVLAQRFDDTYAHLKVRRRFCPLPTHACDCKCPCNSRMGHAAVIPPPPRCRPITSGLALPDPGQR
jgi:hypothetical protein